MPFFPRAKSRIRQRPSVYVLCFYETEYDIWASVKAGWHRPSAQTYRLHLSLVRKLVHKSNLQSLQFLKLRHIQAKKQSQLPRAKRCRSEQKVAGQELFPFLCLATFFLFKSETAFRLKFILVLRKSISCTSYTNCFEYYLVQINEIGRNNVFFMNFQNFAITTLFRLKCDCCVYCTNRNSSPHDLYKRTLIATAQCALHR